VVVEVYDLAAMPSRRQVEVEIGGEQDCIAWVHLQQGGVGDPESQEASVVGGMPTFDIGFLGFLEQLMQDAEYSIARWFADLTGKI
jgi:hypothetical protein